MNEVYHTHGSLYIGYHGCEFSVVEKLLINPNDVRRSTNEYDWLGSGFYVWDDNYERALQWAKDNKKKNPAVVGVVYELGNCLDLMNTNCINLIKQAYKDCMSDLLQNNKPIPQNRNIKADPCNDKILRSLDCAVLNYLNKRTDNAYKEEMVKNHYALFKSYDTVRGCFTEGGKIFDTEIYEKIHIQVCIRNMNCIKGFFKPREAIKFPA